MGAKFVLLVSVAFLFSLSSVSAFEFNGTVNDINGNPLNNTLVNVTIRNPDFSVNGYNWTHTNESGWFNLTVAEITNAFNQPVITWTNTTSNATLWVGQSLPSFPKEMFTEISGTTFYLQRAGTINITAINSTADRVTFRYQVKDTKLGYSIAEDFTNPVNEAIVKVPRDRNYSIMIYPDQSMPVSFDWNNFSASSSYNITVANLSNYEFSTKTLNYQFNTTMTMVRVSGFINHSVASGWDEFTVVPYLLEPGNMVHTDYGDMPYNLSGFSGGTDTHVLGTGFYNISLPGTAETSNILLFATARNGSGFYGSFKNISLTTSSAAETIGFNFTAMTGLFGPGYQNISLDTLTGGQVNVTTSKQVFNLVNATNSSLTAIQGHMEITVDYTNYGLQLGEFTWMTDITQGAANAQFLVPLLNSTGVKEINIFASGGQTNLAPKRVSLTDSQISTGTVGGLYNITMKGFNPGDIDGAVAAVSITMNLFISNSSCDIPSPSASCFIGGSADQGNKTMGDFKPMSAILGGGKLSFRMGTGGILVHYVNVDMLASGPPDALFDDSTTSSTSGSSFDNAVRFGSGGPTIYDYILVSIPYTETAGTGLDDTGDVNISIPILYDDNWNVIWNTTANGTDASALGGNYSHYSARQSEWGNLTSPKTCIKTAVTDSTQINATSPCYIDTTNNRVWIRLPHFSGTGPSVTGTTVAAAASTTTSSSSSSSGGGTASTKSKEVISKPGLESNKGLVGNEKLQTALEKVLGISQLSDQAKQNLLDLSAAIAANTEVTRNATTETGKTKVTTKVKYNGTEKVNKFAFFDVIPKEFADHVDNITITSPGATVEVVNADPEVLFFYDELQPGQEMEVTYELAKRLTTSTTRLNEIIDSFVSGVYGASLGEQVVEGQSTEPEQPGEEPTTQSEPMNPLLIGGVVVLVIIVLAGLFLAKKKK